MLTHCTLRIPLIALALAGFLLLPLAAEAQERERGERPQRERGPRGLTLQTLEAATAELQLSDEQRTQVNDILAAARSETDALRENTELDDRERRRQTTALARQAHTDILAALDEEQQSALAAALPQRPAPPPATEETLRAFQQRVEQLDLNDEQRQQISQLFASGFERIETLKMEGGETEEDTPQDVAPIVRETQQQVMQVLTDEQRQQLRQRQQRQPRDQQAARVLDAA